MKKTIIGISGFARSGKDTLAKHIKKQLQNQGFSVSLFSFARALKQDIDEFCSSRFGISSFCEDSSQKEKIRPMLIAYGNCQRNITNGAYWINKVKPQVDSFFSGGGDFAIISDLRFKEFDYDEYDFFRSYPRNLIFTVSLINEDGSSNRAAHESEEKSFPFFLSNSDFNLKWNKTSDQNYLFAKAKECANIILNKYE